MESTIRTLSTGDMIEICAGLVKAGVQFKCQRDSMTWVITTTGGF